MSKGGHGGRRAGAGRPRVDTVKKMYKLDPAVVKRVKQLAEEQGQTESAIANAMLFQGLCGTFRPLRERSLVQHAK